MKVIVNVEKVAGERNCSCFIDGTIDNCGLFGFGPTVDAAVKDLLVARQELTELEGKNIPELEMSFRYDIWAFFDKFPMNASLVAKRIGINPSLMRQYIAGSKKPSKKRVEQIQEGVRMLGQELSTISLQRFD